METEEGLSSEYSHFVRQVVWRSDSVVDLYVGHDMHGLLPARVAGYQISTPFGLSLPRADYREGQLARGGRLVFGVSEAFRPDCRSGSRARSRSHSLWSNTCVKRAPNGRSQLAASEDRRLPASGCIRLLQPRGYQFSKAVLRQGTLGQVMPLSPRFALWAIRLTPPGVSLSWDSCSKNMSTALTWPRSERGGSRSGCGIAPGFL